MKIDFSGTNGVHMIYNQWGYHTLYYNFIDALYCAK